MAMRARSGACRFAGSPHPVALICNSCVPHIARGFVYLAGIARRDHRGLSACQTSRRGTSRPGPSFDVPSVYTVILIHRDLGCVTAILRLARKQNSLRARSGRHNQNSAAPSARSISGRTLVAPEGYSKRFFQALLVRLTACGTAATTRAIPLKSRRGG